MTAPARPVWRRHLRLAAAAGAFILVLAVGYLGRQVIFLGTTYVAKTVCSAVFVSGRKAQAVLDAEILSNAPGILRLVSVELDRPGSRYGVTPRPRRARGGVPRGAGLHACDWGGAPRLGLAPPPSPRGISAPQRKPWPLSTTSRDIAAS